MIWLIINTALAVVCVLSLLGAGWLYSVRLDLLDRLAMGGLAGALLMTTPALFMSNTPFDGWSFSLSRAFLTIILVKRFLVPVIWCYLANPRQVAQRLQSRARFHDRIRDKL